MHLVEKNHILAKSCHHTYQNYKHPPQRYKNSDFQSQCGKLVQLKNSSINIELGVD